MKRPPREAILPATLGAALYLPMLRATGFCRDDVWLVGEHPLLRSWSTLPALLSLGYWEGAMGSAAAVAEYRPFLMLTLFLNRMLLGPGPWGFHLVDLLLHGAVCGLLALTVTRWLPAAAALAAACIFAVLPVHVEAVAGVTSRSETLSLLLGLLAWRDFRGEPRLWRRGLLWQSLALLTKETAVLFPLIYAAGDYVEGRLKQRQSLHAMLWTATGCALLLRLAALGSRPFHGGVDYFANVGLLTKWLTVSKFWGLHYLWPMLSGLGLNADYSRPLIRDAAPTDAVAWFFLLGGLALAAASTWALWKRKPIGIMGAVFFLPLLPTSNLIIHLDAIGAERFLYIPSIAFCVLVGLFWARIPRQISKPAAVCVLAGYAVLSMLRMPDWMSQRGCSEAAVRDNPVSARAWSGLGTVRAAAGDLDGAEVDFQRARLLDPTLFSVDYNLGLLLYRRGRYADAEKCLSRPAPPDADRLTLLGVLAETRGDFEQAADWYQRALAVRPWDETARYNRARLRQTAGRR